ncbi:MAG: class I SAM-dependent methyltransferase [Actinobacteria bacterium]|nr:class I SAM-dependent methyltransferase [Actinomycetota bacterium]
MTEQGIRAAEPWLDPQFARQWAAHDGIADQLAFPRQIAAAVAAQNRPDARLIVDIGSGPGDFLAVMLEQFPDARGVWTDASAAMRELAEQRLAPYSGRVEYAIVDMTALSERIPRDVDVITTSRAAHHLDRAGLRSFYREVADHLAPGGWLANLDHIGPSKEWDARLRAARKQFRSSAEDGPKHHHNYPLTSVDDHLAALAAAGLQDCEIAWRAFITCLFLARRDG